MSAQSTESLDEYVRLSAISAHTMLVRQIENSYPDSSLAERDGMILGIIEHMALLRGWAICYVYPLDEEEKESEP